MKKKVLALAIASASFAGALNATTVYDDGNKKLEINGRVKGYFVTGSDIDGLEYKNGSSRLTLSGESKLDNGLALFGRTEWAYNAAATSEDAAKFISHRLSYAGVKGDFGSFSVGRQWSAYSNVGAYTDQFEYAGGEANLMYSDGDSGGMSGLARANDSLQYNAQFGDLTVTAIAQGTRTMAGLERTRDYGAGLALEYKVVDGLTFGVASHMTQNDLSTTASVDSGDVDGDGNAVFEDVKTTTYNNISTSTVAGAKLLTLDGAVYMAVTGSYHTDIADGVLSTSVDTATEVTRNAFNGGFVEQAIGAEAFVAFFYDKELQSGVYAGYNYLTAENAGVSINPLHYAEVGVRHVFLPATYVYAAYNHDLRTSSTLVDFTSDGNADHRFAFGARYSF